NPGSGGSCERLGFRGWIHATAKRSADYLAGYRRHVGFALLLVLPVVHAGAGDAAGPGAPRATAGREPGQQRRAGYGTVEPGDPAANGSAIREPRAPGGTRGLRSTGEDAGRSHQPAIADRE